MRDRPAYTRDVAQKLKYLMPALILPGVPVCKGLVCGMKSFGSKPA